MSLVLWGLSTAPLEVTTHMCASIKMHYLCIGYEQACCVAMSCTLHTVHENASTSCLHMQFAPPLCQLVTDSNLFQQETSLATDGRLLADSKPVSYTHLTLPTILLV